MATDKPCITITNKQADEFHTEIKDIPVDNVSRHHSVQLQENTSTLVPILEHEASVESCAGMDKEMIEMIPPLGNVKDVPIASTLTHPVEQHQSEIQEAVPLVYPATIEDKSSDGCYKGLHSLSTIIDNAAHTKARISKKTSAKKCCKVDSSLSVDGHQRGKRRKVEDFGLQQVNTESHCSLALTVPEEFHFSTDKRARVYKGSGYCGSSFEVEGSKSPFVSLAERVHKFQAKTPERYHSGTSHVDNTSRHFKRKELMLTRPTYPKLRTSFRARPTSVKCFLEKQEEILANIPKFKARPLNKRILQAPTLPLLQRTTPDLPSFQEFNLQTAARASLHHTRCTDKIELSFVFQAKENIELVEANRNVVERCIRIRGEPHLETALRARLPRIKSTEEMEVEELERIPKFKARQFNKRIFSSRGDLGVYRNAKRQATRPMEFHFLTDERATRHSALLINEVDRIANSNQQARDEFHPKLTIPQPFHLSTEERGALKQYKFQMELLMQEEAERKKSIPKANMLPYTTDVPKIPSKPQPRAITKPEPFHLESVRRHEEEVHHRMEEISRTEKVYSEMRIFHAQPILCNAPVFIPERSRKPLTEIQPFVFRAEARAIERSEFDRKVAEKKMKHWKMKEELELARRLEEERAVKELRNELVFQAKPVPEFGASFIPLRSGKELTQPISPRFHTAMLDLRRHRNTSTMPVYHMR